MLRQLDIHNIALIDHVSIELAPGFNILTGETGAGKSIIIDSIHGILGERVSKDLIRTGKEKASVEAVFEIATPGVLEIFEKFGIEPEEDGTVIISREFTQTGKNTCRINGKMATLSMLKELGEQLIDIHGQYDNQSLLRTESHIRLLDLFGGETIEQIKNQYSTILEAYKETKSRLKSISGNVGERERKIDLLKFQIDEISEAELQTGEEESLIKQRMILSNSEKIMDALSLAYAFLLSGSNSKSSASDNINEALRELSNISKLDERFQEIKSRVEDISYQLEDITEEIRSQRDQVEYNPEILESIGERLDLIFRLKRKYGNTVEEVMKYGEGAQKELQELNDSEEAVVRLNQQLSKLSEDLYQKAYQLHLERVKAAQLLEKSITHQMNDLEMKKASFKVKIEFDDTRDANKERKFGNNGLEKIEFLISPNAGEPLKPLSKIASGGEMSRIMLAIKTILANVDEMPTLIFDEIDIGVSGRAAQKVGEKLSFLSKNHQVLCVTHLAQIASMADNHFLIQKFSQENKTETRVEKLNSQGIIEEIARILGGANISEITLKHAEEMISNALQWKQVIN